MKALRVLMLTLLTVGLLGATAYGAGFAVRHYDGPVPTSAPATSTPAPTPTTTPSAPAPSSSSPAPSAPPSPSAPSSPTIESPPEAVLEPGATGMQVRELQSRLFQIAWFPELTTGTYDGATREAVSGFQVRRGLAATGVVDQRTWNRLVAMTGEPTRDQLLNVLHPGPVLLTSGASGEEVRELQARLVATQWLFGDVSGSYDATTAAAVRGFQAKREIPVTGAVDQRTLDRLYVMTSQPTYEQMHNVVPEVVVPGADALDPRCETGRVMCVDKTTNSLRWVVDGQVLATYDVRFGSDELPTREGAFSVERMSRDHVSSLYDTPMPYAMFFSGGQAVHYSPDFAANGYNGASHGCVNVRDHDGVAALFDQVRIGDEVIVYWS